MDVAGRRQRAYTTKFPALERRHGRRRRPLASHTCGDLKLPDELVAMVVKRTEGASGAFIGELMRKMALAMIEAGRSSPGVAHLETAFGDMLTNASDLNRRLLGASEASASRP
ncbi:MAG: hypothetical protein AAGJ56_03905 [Myxococcota bacterium]